MGSSLWCHWICPERAGRGGWKLDFMRQLNNTKPKTMQQLVSCTPNVQCASPLRIDILLTRKHRIAIAVQIVHFIHVSLMIKTLPESWPPQKIARPNRTFTSGASEIKTSNTCEQHTEDCKARVRQVHLADRAFVKILPGVRLTPALKPQGDPSTYLQPPSDEGNDMKDHFIRNMCSTFWKC